MGKLIGILLVLVLLLGAGAAGAWFYGQQVYAKAGPVTADGKPRVVLVAKGDNAQEIAAKLKEAGAIEDEFQFRTALRVLDFFPGKDGKITLKPGEYDLASGASIKDIIDEMSVGKMAYYTVIVPEGLTSQMIVDLLEREEWNTTNRDFRPTEEAIAAQKAAWEKLPAAGKRAFRVKWGRTLKLAGPKPATPAEGVLLPGDYAVERGATIASVIDRMVKAQQTLLAEIWPTRQGGLPVKTPDEALILASVVQNEAGNSGEQARVASVFTNRLRKPMRLESDPTIVYGLTKGVPLGHGITVSERAMKTAWNTYQIDGLPKTPICNPGAESIKAVLNPPTTPFYYFVANGTVNHAFAETYAEHLRNVAVWREFEAQRDGAKAPAAAPAAKPKTPAKARP